MRGFDERPAAIRPRRAGALCRRHHMRRLSLFGSVLKARPTGQRRGPARVSPGQRSRPAASRNRGRALGLPHHRADLGAHGHHLAVEEATSAPGRAGVAPELRNGTLDADRRSSLRSMIDRGIAPLPAATGRRRRAISFTASPCCSFAWCVPSRCSRPAVEAVSQPAKGAQRPTAVAAPSVAMRNRLNRCQDFENRLGSSSLTMVSKRT